jgi:hypothetical protein
MGFFNKLVSNVIGNLVPLPVQKPIQFTKSIIESAKTLSTKPFSKFIQEQSNRTIKQSTIDVARATAVVGSVVAPISIVPKAGLVVASMVLPSVVGNAPKQTLSAIEKTSSGLPNFGENVGQFIAEPSLQKAKDIITENPVISGIVAGAGALAIGGAIPAVAGYVAGKIGGDNQPADVQSPLSNNLPREKSIPTQDNMPVESPTETIQTGKRKRRHSKPTKPQNITQRVNIVFDDDYIDNKNKRFK